MARAGVEIDSAEVDKLLKEFPDHLFDAAKKALREAMFGTQRTVKNKFNKDPSNSLQSRTGDLSRSILTTLRGTTTKNLFAEVFTKKIYAPIHEEGGTIKAKNAFKNLPGGPYLAIPSDQNKTAAGVTRLSPRDAFLLDTVILKIKNPKKAEWLILQKDIGPLFWLVKEVDIKARLGMQKAADDEIPTLLSTLDELLLEDL